MIFVYIVFGILAVVVIFWVLMFMFGRARMQHYVFAHQTLPSSVFENHQVILTPLVSAKGSSSEGRMHLLKLWQVAAEGLPEQDLVSGDTLAYSMVVLGHPNSTAFFIQLPKAERKTEAHFSLIVFDAPGLSVGKVRHLRYFVLENYGEADGKPKTNLGEWVRKGDGLKYVDHGKGTPADKAAFMAAVEKIVKESGSQP
jgi:hypothetical protein